MMNRTGGRYFEDPKTGVVTRDEPEPETPIAPPAEPTPAEETFSTDPETVAPKASKKG